MTESYKSKKRRCLETMLRWMAVLVLKKYQPKIIGITGSVGKTSTKEAVYSVLSKKYRTRRNEKNYNNEVGLPLTIIGVESGGRSFWGWLRVSLKWMTLMLLPIRYPKILILEMGADHPGDIGYLTSFIKPDVGILTEIAESHVEFFKSINEIAKEKSRLIKCLEKKDLAVLNYDNQKILEMKNQTQAEVITCGFSDQADIRATDISFVYSSDGDNHYIQGLSFKLNYKGTVLPVRLRHILASHQIYAALLATAVGLRYNMNLVSIAEALENFSTLPGRMKLIRGIKSSYLIDDTYNSSPAALSAAFKVMGEIRAERKIAVMGDMLELGTETENAHRKIAEQFINAQGEIFYSVGVRMKYAAEELARLKFSKDKIKCFDNPQEAGEKLKEIIKPNDLVLIKGSQGIRMEKAVYEIMAEPDKAEFLLCRQSKEWQNIPFKPV
jgi:UDP-N-acetylmuramoyl-tripeptide--D-alanyl-D-alanine ligase